jgi:hypothetical protein
MQQTIAYKPVRIQQRRGVPGWRKPADCRSVARNSRWGNPYEEKVYGREEAIRLFEQDLMNGVLRTRKNDGTLRPPIGPEDVKRELRGWLLACYCPLELPCHADVLLRIASED